MYVKDQDGNLTTVSASEYADVFYAFCRFYGSISGKSREYDTDLLRCSGYLSGSSSCTVSKSVSSCIKTADQQYVYACMHRIYHADQIVI